MGRIPLVQYEDASPELRALYDQIEAARGSVLNIHKGVANHFEALSDAAMTRAKHAPRGDSLGSNRGV